MSRFEKLITKLFPDDPISQRMAANFAETFASNPQIGEDRVAALLQEGARVNAAVASGQITAEAAFAQLSGFAGTIGTPEHLVTDGMAFLQSGAGLTAEDFAAGEPPPTEPPQAPPQPAQPAPAAVAPPSGPLVDRAALQRAIKLHEQNMRAPEGSPEWRSYWKEGGSVEYRAALEQLEASTNAIAGLAASAPAPAQPAPPAPAPAAAQPPPAGAPA